MSAGARGWGGGHSSKPHIDRYLSQIPRERIMRRTGPGQGVQFTPALHSEAKHTLRSRGPWQINCNTSESAENEGSRDSFSCYNGLALQK